MSVQSAQQPSAAAEAPSALTYAWYVVAVLTAAYLLSLIDRILIGLLVEPIKADMLLADTQIGLLVGFGFVLFYSTLGVPLGSLADSSNRRNLIAAGITVWSLATVACGLATNFTSLLIARMMVGAGEATLFPCAISTFSDRFPREKLGLAMSIFSFGALAGMGLAMAGGGELVRWAATIGSVEWLGFTLAGWRLVFVVIGLVGIPVALLVLTTVREAPRLTTPAVAPPFRDLIRAIASHRRAYFGLFAGFGAQVLSTYIPMTWAAAYYQRTFGLTPQVIGWSLGFIFAVCGGIGLVIGGRWSDKRASRGVIDSPAEVLMWSIPMQLPLICIAFLVQSPTASLIALGILLIVASMYGGLQGTIVRLMSPAGMQGRLMALYLLIVTIVGMGCGPLIVGALSDRVYTGQWALGQAVTTTMAAAVTVAGSILVFTRPAMRAVMQQILDRELQTRRSL